MTCSVLRTYANVSHSKRVGIDKAIYQVQQAARRAGQGGGGSRTDEAVVARLRHILHELDSGATGISPSNESHTGDSMSEDDDDDGEDGEAQDEDMDEGSFSGTGAGTSHRRGAGTSRAASGTRARTADADAGAAYRRRPRQNLAVEDAENPLQLLARASYFTPSAQQRGKRPAAKTRHDGAAAGDSSAPEHVKLNDFFSITRSDLDIGDDIDPISLGLVEEDEAEMLFK